MACALLTSCGNYHYSRSGKIRTVRVQTASKDKVESQPKELVLVEENVIYTESIVPTEHRSIDPPEQEIVVKLEKQDLEEASVRIETLEKEEIIETSDQQAPIQIEKTKSKIKKPKKGPKKKRKIKIDWGLVWFYLGAAILLTALVIGLIYAPLITLSVLSTLLVILIVVIVVGIISIFSGLFDALFDIF